MPKKTKKQITYENCSCPYCMTRIDGTNFCAYWDCRDYITKENTPDATCLEE